MSEFRVGHYVRIEIWSDLVCPWCFLGHRRFVRAVEELTAERGSEFHVDVRWRAFELVPHAPHEPQELQPVIDKMYGPGAFDGMTQRLAALGVDEGIDYRFDLAQRVSTFDAHRLMAAAADLDGGSDGAVQNRLVEGLFRAYFTEGANLADHETLGHIAEAAGFEQATVQPILSSDRFTDEVRSDELAAREHGITGVPAFVVNNQLMIPGAQDTATLVRLLGRAADRMGD